jgi:hypothetical protein
MSMLTLLRDTAALIELELELQRVRERQLRAFHEGRPMEAAELKEAEAQAIDKVKRQFYCLQTRLAFMPAEEADKLTDPADYQGRQYADTEFCILDAHRRILSQPCAGDPRFVDPDA